VIADLQQRLRRRADPGAPVRHSERRGFRMPDATRSPWRRCRCARRRQPPSFAILVSRAKTRTHPRRVVRGRGEQPSRRDGGRGSPADRRPTGRRGRDGRLPIGRPTGARIRSTAPGNGAFRVAPVTRDPERSATPLPER
jgi:hypothetical protein